MKILMVNKFHYLKGGSEKYYFELAELLREHGHEVAFFSLNYEKNIKNFTLCDIKEAVSDMLSSSTSITGYLLPAAKEDK